VDPVTSTVLIGMICATVWAVASRQKSSRRQRILAQLWELLGGSHNGVDTASGSALGARATLRFTSEGVGRDLTHWTLIDVDLPAQHPFALHLRRRSRGDAAAQLLDSLNGILTGDPLKDLEELTGVERDFGRDYRVFAAPTAVARIVLHPGMCEYLASFGSLELTTHRGEDDEHAVLRLVVCRWLDDFEGARQVLKAMVSIATGLGAAYEEVERADRAEGAATGGAPFRPELPGPLAQDAANARADEVARLEEALASLRH
jgi:hypothetical protein